MSDIITKNNVSVKGGKLADGVQFKLRVTVDYTVCSREELIRRANQSDVITLQRGWREKADLAELRKMQADGVTVTWDQVTSAKGAVIDLRASLKTLGWSDEQVELVMANKDLAMKLMDEITKVSEQ